MKLYNIVDEVTQLKDEISTLTQRNSELEVQVRRIEQLNTSVQAGSQVSFIHEKRKKNSM